MHRQDPDPRFRRAVHAADRAPRARGARLLRDPSRTTSATTSSATFAPRGIILSGSHASVTEDDTPRAPAGGVRARRAGARHLLRHADDGGAARRQGRGRHACASSATPRCARAATPTLLDGIEDFAHRRRPRHARRLDEPRRQGHRAAAGLQADGVAPTLPDRRRWPTRRAASTRVQFHPEVTHTQQGAAHARALRARHLRLRAPTGTCATTSTKRSRAIREQVGDDEVILGLSGGVDSSRRRGADPPRDRRPAHLRVRRPRPAAPERRRAGDGHVRRAPAA